MSIEDFVPYDIIVKSVESETHVGRLKAQFSRTHCAIIAAA